MYRVAESNLHLLLNFFDILQNILMRFMAMFFSYRYRKFHTFAQLWIFFKFDPGGPQLVPQ